jgi:hypothetical protein
MGFVEIKGIDDRLTVIAILAKNGYLVRQKKIEQAVNGKKVFASGIEYDKPDDPLISVSRRDDE